MTQVTINLESNGKYACSIDGTSFKTGNTQYIEFMFKKITGIKKSYEEINAMSTGSTLVAAPKKEKVADKFSINQRFSFVEQLVKMVASGVQPSAVLVGQGGLGKTYTVTKTLEAQGFKDITSLADFEVGQLVNLSKSFVMVKGFSTARGLYDTLYSYNGATIIFDDCDSVLKDPVAINILKGALDSYDKRIITWNSRGFMSDDIPRSFQFTGRVIFISNMVKESIDQAIRSRSMLIDLSMTIDQKIERMEFIASKPEFLPEYSAQDKLDAINLIKKVKEDAREISLRTLISVTKIRATNDDWENLAIYTLCA